MPRRGRPGSTPRQCWNPRRKRFKRRYCETKAKKMAASTTKWNKEEYRHYYCSHCQYWHVGRPPKNRPTKKELIRKLKDELGHREISNMVLENTGSERKRLKVLQKRMRAALTYNLRYPKNAQ